MSLATLDEWIRDIRDAAGGIEAAVPEVAKARKAAADQELAAGHGIGGEEWVARKDGGQPLANAAAALVVDPVGNVIVFRLPEPYVFHHFGAGRVPRRPILPTAGLPDNLGHAIREGLIQGLPFMKKHGRKK